MAYTLQKVIFLHAWFEFVSLSFQTANSISQIIDYSFMRSNGCHVHQVVGFLCKD